MNAQKLPQIGAVLAGPEIKTDIISLENDIADLPLTISRFPKSVQAGGAFGQQVDLTWGHFVDMFRRRREGEKDGPCFAAATFTPEPDGTVRRLKSNTLNRTCLALDYELNKTTGELPPDQAVLFKKLAHFRWAALAYSSHNHKPDAPRRRLVLPLSGPIAPHLPAVEIIAELLGVAGVLDTSKTGASSLFFFPSCPPGGAGGHEFEVIDGEPVSSEWIVDLAEQRLEEIERQQAKARAVALAEAEKRRAAKIAGGWNHADSLIEKLRDRLDLKGELLKHGYAEIGKSFLFPNSQSGIPGAMILRGDDGIERFYSHHGSDPLAVGNLPTWCTTEAIDALDVALILEHRANSADDVTKALHKMAVAAGLQTERPKRHEVGDGDWTQDVPPADDLNVDNGNVEDKDPAAGNGSSLTPAALIIDENAWSEAKIPRRDWIAVGYFLRYAITLIAGAPGASKSSIILVWSCALALGREFQRFRPDRPMRVSIYNLEDDQQEQKRRLSAILRQFDATPADLGGKVARITPTGAGALFEFDQQTGKIRETDAMKALVKHLTDFTPDVLFLDPFAGLHGAPENDNISVQAIMAKMRTLAADHHLSIGLAHHTRKGPQVAGDPDTARGASAIIGAVRVVLTVVTMQEPEAIAFGLKPEDRKHYFRVDAGKSNYSALQDAEWFQRPSLRLANGDDVASPEPWTPPADAVTSETRSAVEAGIAAGSSVGPWSPRLSDDARSVKNLFTQKGIHTQPGQRALLKALLAAGFTAQEFQRSNRSVAQGLRSPAGKPAARWLDDEATSDVDVDTMTGVAE